MDNNNKGKAELRKSVHRVLLVALDKADESLLALITMLEGCNYEVTKCIGAEGVSSLPNMARSGFDIILTEGNMNDPEDGFIGFPKILGGMNLPIVMITSNNGNIKTRYHCSAGHIVTPLLKVVGEHFRKTINPSNEVKQMNMRR